METYTLDKKPHKFNAQQDVVVTLCVANATEWKIPLLLLTDTIVPEKKIFDGKMKLSIDRNTKGVGATANRNAEILIYHPMLVSLYEEHLLNNPGITPAQKLALNIKAAPSSAVKTIPPVSTPVSQIHHVESLAHFFDTRDSLTGKKARPDNVNFSEVRYVVGTVPPKSVKDCTESDFLTNTRNVVRFNEADRNKNAYYYERWVNNIGQVGPWTVMFFAVIT